jgi:hypothetical protein
MLLSLNAGGRAPRRLLASAALGLAVTLAGAASASAAQLIQNGGFEDGGGSLSGWTVTGSVLALTAADYAPCCGTTGSEPGYSSDHFAAFGAGDAAGPHMLSQSFATVIGATYHLSFLSGALGLPGDQALSYAPLGDQADGGVDNVVVSNFDDAFNGFNLDFVATEGSTTLRFIVGTPGVDGHDAILDDVSVTGPAADGGGGAGVPEPAAWALMLTGFGAMGAMLRRRQAQRALVPA